MVEQTMEGVDPRSFDRVNGDVNPAADPDVRHPDRAAAPIAERSAPPTSAKPQSRFDP